jgi:hypothetical protein
VASIDIWSSQASLAASWTSALPPHREPTSRAYTIITSRPKINDTRLPKTNKLTCFDDPSDEFKKSGHLKWHAIFGKQMANR